MNILGFFQRLGRALQLPIAVLPVAALLLRFGQPDLLNVAFIAQAGGAIFRRRRSGRSTGDKKPADLHDKMGEVW